MANFNKCKDCGNTDPAAWAGNSKSLCLECAETRQRLRNAADQRSQTSRLATLGMMAEAMAVSPPRGGR